MSMKKAMTAGMVAAAAALAITGANNANAKEEGAEKEKCYGVVKAGHNDCGDAVKAHSCMSHAMEDGNANEWIALPAGLCEKLVGGSLTPGEGGTKASCKSKAGCEAMPDMQDKGAAEDSAATDSHDDKGGKKE